MGPPPFSRRSFPQSQARQPDFILTHYLGRPESFQALSVCGPDTNTPGRSHSPEPIPDYRAQPHPLPAHLTYINTTPPADLARFGFLLQTFLDPALCPPCPFSPSCCFLRRPLRICATHIIRPHVASKSLHPHLDFSTLPFFDNLTNTAFTRRS